jgi:hypothetical protein
VTVTPNLKNRKRITKTAKTLQSPGSDLTISSDCQAWKQPLSILEMFKIIEFIGPFYIYISWRLIEHGKVAESGPALCGFVPTDFNFENLPPAVTSDAILPVTVSPTVQLTDSSTSLTRGAKGVAEPLDTDNNVVKETITTDDADTDLAGLLGEKGTIFISKLPQEEMDPESTIVKYSNPVIDQLTPTDHKDDAQAVAMLSEKGTTLVPRPPQVEMDPESTIVKYSNPVIDQITPTDHKDDAQAVAMLHNQDYTPLVITVPEFDLPRPHMTPSESNINISQITPASNSHSTDQLFAQPAAAQPEGNCVTPQLGTHQQT